MPSPNFPVPRSALPRVHVGPEEAERRRQQMQRMLHALVADYERLGGRDVSRRWWKPAATRDRLRLYKARRPSTETAPGASRAADFSRSCSDVRSELPAFDFTSTTQSQGAPSRSRGRGPSADAAESMPLMMLVGEFAGRLENAMHAVLARNQEELALVDIFLHEDVADCAVLAEMEGPTAGDPYHFLGYKWFVRRSPMPSKLVKHRDSVYVESCGLTKTRGGVVLGYHIMHSVDLPAFPPMPERNCIRSAQSIRTLYRQRPGNVVEIFSMGNIELSGFLTGPLASMFVHDTLFSMPKLIDCGESKRLTRWIQARRDAAGPITSLDACALCRHPKRLFRSSLVPCDICGAASCGKCRISRRVFESEGILGRFRKVVCCKTCVLAAKDGARDCAEASSRSLCKTPRTLAASDVGTDADAPWSRPTTSTRWGSTSSSSVCASSYVIEESDLTRLDALSSDDLDSPVSSSSWMKARPTMSPPAFTASVRGRRPIVLSPAPRSPPPPRNTSSRGTTDKELLLLQMLELTKKAEDAYHTTRQNQVYLANGPERR